MIHQNRRSFLCTDEQLDIYNGYDRTEALNYKIIFERCDNTTAEVTCKSEDEIQSWLEGKFYHVMTRVKLL